MPRIQFRVLYRIGLKHGRNDRVAGLVKRSGARIPQLGHGTSSPVAGAFKGSLRNFAPVGHVFPQQSGLGMLRAAGYPS
jgi:hypothetical protein